MYEEGVTNQCGQPVPRGVEVSLLTPMLVNVEHELALTGQARGQTFLQLRALPRS